MSTQSQYSTAVVDGMQFLFGEGFLSPGGPREIFRIFGGQSLAGCKVLDWGCGVGGATIALATELGADDVTGIDLEAASLEAARALARANGVDDQVAFQLVDPGAAPFADNTFDVVFSKEAICHVDDKVAVFKDFIRVLKPGGSFTGSDWVTAGPDPQPPEVQAFFDQLSAAVLVFRFMTSDEHKTVFEASGFRNIVLSEDPQQTLAEARATYERVRGDAREQLTRELGASGYAAFAARTQVRTAAIECGGFYRCHMRASKEACK